MAWLGLAIALCPSILRADIASFNNTPAATAIADVVNNPATIDTSSSTNTNATVTPAPIMEEKGFWSKAWGTAMPTTIYLGMVTTHFNPASDTKDNWNNNLIAASYDGFFVGTFLNSFGVRAYAAGIARYWFTTDVTPNFNYSLGYRLGLVSGYTKTFIPLAAYTPVLPFPQVVYDLSYHNVGLELSWCVVTVSAGFFYRF